MKQWRGVWMHDDEQHYQEWMSKVNHIVNGKPTYQYAKYQTARDLCKQRRRVIDVGANIGLWAMHMQDDFEVVECFEPVEAYADIILHNAPKVYVHRCALGTQEGECEMVRANPHATGDSRPRVTTDPQSEVQNTARMTTLDSYEFTNVDLIKVDCEGFELYVLRGGLQTIMQNKPVIIVEQKPGHGATYGEADDAAVNYLRALGMRQHTVLSGDHIMVW
jgi:FkbM family methyltransferase